jgi:2-polyprenyl-3-methyl-5-hydroxy-6-metoxy-1,4-benzoquinol methylase
MNCGVAFQWPRRSDKEYEDFYESEEYDAKVYRQPVEAFMLMRIIEIIGYMRTFEVQATSHLDFGCGSGVLAASIQKEYGIKSYGVELSPHFRELAKAAGVDCVSRLIELPDIKFDLITMTEVLEHLPNPIYVLKELDKLMVPGGNLIVSVPDVRIDLVPALNIDRHLTGFTEIALVKLIVSSLNYAPVHLWMQPPQYRTLMFHARKPK